MLMTVDVVYQDVINQFYASKKASAEAATKDRYMHQFKKARSRNSALGKLFLDVVPIMDRLFDIVEGPISRFIQYQVTITI